MERTELVKTIKGLLTVNQKEHEAVEEAVKILEATRWRDAEYEPPEVDEDRYSDKILLGFSNYILPAIGEYRVDKEGGAYYEGDDDTPLIQYGLIVNGWMPLPERMQED